MLRLKQWIRFHDYILLRPIFKFVDGNKLTALQRLSDFRIHTHGDFLGFEQVGHLPYLLLYLVTNGFRRFRPTGTTACRARPAKSAFQRRLSALSSNGDETEIIKLQDL